MRVSISYTNEQRYRCILLATLPGEIHIIPLLFFSTWINHRVCHEITGSVASCAVCRAYSYAHATQIDSLYMYMYRYRLWIDDIIGMNSVMRSQVQ